MTVSDQLRQAIEDSGETLYRVAKDSGVSYPTLHGFVGGRDIKLSNADKIADYLGLSLWPKAEPRPRRHK